MIHTLIADDQELVRGGFAMILESEPDIEVVGQASDGKEAVHACRELQPDVVLMDVRMPIMDGIEATRQITSLGQARVLMLTTFDLDSYIYDAFLAGASGFLLKDVRRSELIHAVETVAFGETLVAPAITRRLVEEFVRRPHPGESPSQLKVLTAREIEILALVRERPLQLRDCVRTDFGRSDCQDARQPNPYKARTPRPSASCRARL